MDALGDARPALLALSDLANAIGGAGTWTYAHPDAVTDEIAANVAGYERFAASSPFFGKARAFELPSRFETQTVEAAAPARPGGDMVLTTGRTLFTSLEGAEIRSDEADKLHREEFVEISSGDAAALGLRDEDEITLETDAGAMTLRCKISDRVLDGVVYVPWYYDGGAVNALLARGGASPSVRIKVAATA
jgi:predicted molibdopterin-dependent oxidoreductase YjgC